MPEWRSTGRLGSARCRVRATQRAHALAVDGQLPAGRADVAERGAHPANVARQAADLDGDLEVDEVGGLTEAPRPPPGRGVDVESPGEGVVAAGEGEVAGRLQEERVARRRAGHA